MFVGKHIYQSRVLRDGYTIDDVIEQISSALLPDSVVFANKVMTGLQNPRLRADAYGNQVKDLAVFECTTRYPRPELFSVMPKGDRIRPQKQKGHLPKEMALSNPE